MSDDVFDLAKEIAQAAVRSAASKTIDQAPEIKKAVTKEVTRIVEQDPVGASWRVWGAVWSTAAAVLAIPEVQTGLQAVVGSFVPVAWAPVVPAAMGAIWAVVSKTRDIRPVRGK